jgi:hypothetical protein
VKRHALIALLAVASLLGTGCRREPAPAGKSSLPIAVSGPEVLAFRGNVYNIVTTYYLAFPEGLQYTMEYEVPASIDVLGISDERAYEIAYPLMRGAIDQGWPNRTKVKRIGGATPTVSRIGVVMYSHGSRSRGTRVARDIKVVEAGT